MFYGYASNRESKHDVFSRKRIIAVTHVRVMKWYGYGYLEEIIIRREDQTLHKFKEGDFPRLNLCDIEDLLLLLVQKKLSNLEKDVIFNLNLALRILTRRIVILKRSDTKVITMKMEILLKPTSNKLLVERFNASPGNHVNEILLKLNLPDHRSNLTDSNVTPTKPRRMTKPDSSLDFIASCFITDSLKDGHGERFNASAGNHVKEILLKLNLPDHRSNLNDLNVTPTKPGRMTKPDSSLDFIANCFITDSLKDGHGDITSKESTLQVVYDVLRITPFYKAFLVTADTFDELPFEEEILAFLRYLRHSGEIKKITDVNINKLHQLWRSFAVGINKSISGKSTGKILYIKSSTKIPKRAMRCTTPDSQRDDQMFTTIKLVSRHQNTQHFGAILPVELTNEDIRNSAHSKEYYAIVSGATSPKKKASVRKTQSSSDSTMPPPTATGTRLSTLAKRKQPAKSSKAKDKGTSIIPGVPNVPTDESDEEISWKSSDEDDDDVDDQSDAAAADNQEDEDEQDDDDQDSDNDGDDFVHPKLSTHDEEAKDEKSFDPIVQTPSRMEDSDDESNDDESHDMNVRGDEGHDAKDDNKELYSDININLKDGQQLSSSVSSQFVMSMFNPSPNVGIDSIFESTPRVDVPVKTIVVPLLVTAPTLPPPIMSQTLEANFFEFMQTNQFTGAISSIPAQAKNEDFLIKLDENIQRIIKEQVKEQVKVQVSKILPKIKKTVNEQLEAEVLTRLSNSSNSSYVVAADLSKLELKKILIENMESNKSIHRSNEQRNLYKALVDAYECDKIILDTYGDTVTLKRHRDDADKDEEPSAGSDRGSKRRREGKEPDSTSAPKEKASKTTGKSTKGSKSYQKTASESAPAEEPIQTTQDLEEPSHQEFETATHRSIQPWISNLAKQADSRASFNELMDTPVDFSAFLMNRLNVDTMTPELLAGPTYELMKGSCKSLVELEFFFEEVYKATTDQLDWNNPEGQQYPHNLLKPLPLIPNSRGRRVIPFDHFINNDLEYLRGGRKRQQFYGFAVNRESAQDVYSKRRIIIVTELQIVEWHNYKHQDWITMRRDDDKLYKFKEGDLKRLRIQDIKDMLLLLVQGKLTNLTIKECFAFNVSLRMFTRSIVI
nr:hypothetical protein [Tanacetum cinerariifolium]